MGVMAGSRIVAECMGDQLEPSGVSIGQAEANARLIAAAPETAAERDKLLAFEVWVHNWLFALHAELLAALRGMVQSCTCKDGRIVYVQKGYPPRNEDCTRCTRARAAIAKVEGRS